MAMLVLVFCLMSSPSTCREEKPSLAEMPLSVCMVQGQQFASNWQADHPKWQLSGWRCVQGGGRAS